ncbi:threonine ammonia-lyase IlvA [Marinobacterium marinum]|uniref:Threonine ammonia-lyase IlvA n=1 Tax=Marinobacterium marinum TaxID=2756129 RepID=A0A7W1X0M3_9GAMM|nr:threonine ammonia-lyase IlvA [Marinobacterium marinum]MBA4503705.1 threonine ammonia-lyase IlvA [Marinobacterium marinum]
MTTAASALPAQSNPLLPTTADIMTAADRLAGIVRHTPLQRSEFLSRAFNANVLLKREDLQPVRSFKLRGAYNRMVQLTEAQRQRGIVCASAGNHSQGVAFSCQALGISGTLFMPANTPALKVNKARQFGGQQVRIVLTGQTFDDACAAAREFERQQGATFIHPFDDVDVICGQGTLGLELLHDQPRIDYLFVPVGGGGLAAGLGTVFNERSPHTRLIGVEPNKAAALKHSLSVGHNHSLAQIDPFVDGAATQRIGELGFEICQRTLNRVVSVPDADTCQALINLYQEEAIVAELSGCLSIAALTALKDEIAGKTLVCILSGGNNDFHRFADIAERAACR